MNRIIASLICFTFIFTSVTPAQAEGLLLDPIAANQQPGIAANQAALKPTNVPTPPDATTAFLQAGPLSTATPAAKTTTNKDVKFYFGVEEGGTVSGVVFIRPNLEVIPGIRKIHFFLNDEQAGRVYEAPFIWGGSEGFDTKILKNGKYKLSGFYTDESGDHDFVINFNVLNTGEGASLEYLTGGTWTAPEPKADAVMYRFVHKSGNHYYTIHTAEVEQLKKNADYTYQGEMGFVSSNPEAGYSAMHRFYNAQTGSFFFTTNLQNNKPVAGYVYQGIVAYIPLGRTDLRTVYQFYNTLTKRYFYSSHAYETQWVKSGGAGPGWVFQGALGSFAHSNENATRRFYNAQGVLLKEAFYYQSTSIVQNIIFYDLNKISRVETYTRTGKIQDIHIYKDGSKIKSLWHENGLLIKTVTYYEGTTQAHSMAFYHNGVLVRIEGYTKTGICVDLYFYEKGKLARAKWVGLDGRIIKEIGFFAFTNIVSYMKFYEQGALVKIEYYHQNGKLMDVEIYKKDCVHNCLILTTWYDEEGFGIRAKDIGYFAGTQDVEFMRFYDSAGKLATRYEVYYLTGQLREKHVYSKGVITSSKWYNEYGDLVREAFYYATSSVRLIKYYHWEKLLIEVFYKTDGSVEKEVKYVAEPYDQLKEGQIVNPEPKADVVMHRFLNNKTGAHFYTIHAVELTAYLKNADWTYQGEMGYVSSNAEPGYWAMHRYYNASNGSYFFTVNQLTNKPRAGYAYQGIVAYIPAGRQDLKILHQFYNSATNRYFYSTDPNEINSLIAAGGSWHHQGVAGAFAFSNTEKMRRFYNSLGQVIKEVTYYAGSNVVRQIRSFENLKLVKWETFNRIGKVQDIHIYQKGFKINSQWHENGFLIKEVTYYANTNIVHFMKYYQKGVIIRQEAYDINGKCRDIAYFDCGVLVNAKWLNPDGTSMKEIGFYPSGKNKYMKFYDKGMITREEYYREDGTIIDILIYKKGELNISLWHNEQGKLEKEITYFFGTEQMEQARIFNTSGGVTRVERFYITGVLRESHAVNPLNNLVTASNWYDVNGDIYRSATYYADQTTASISYWKFGKIFLTTFYKPDGKVLKEEGTPIDPVLLWNYEALEAIKQSTNRPPTASRQLAIMNTAVFDAVSLAQGKKPILVTGVTAPTGASAEAAAAAAAHYALLQDYPNLKAKLDATLESQLALIKDPVAREKGRLLGIAVAKKIIQMRSTDGSNAASNYAPSGNLGSWEKTLPNFEEPAMPQWGSVTPFMIHDPKKMYPAGPPTYDQKEWVDAYNEVKGYDINFHKVATGQPLKEETQIALFWADGIGTYGPPGHWNLIALDVAKNKNLSLYESARLFAMLNMAIADTCITTWGVKFTYDNWRPITAIRNGDKDGNPLTEKDANWTPLVDTPPFPDYVSGHSSFGGAAAAVLSYFFGDNVAFTTSSFGQAASIDVSGFKNVRSFTSFSQAAKETSVSRIYGGIHFRFSDIDGVATGNKVGTEVIKLFNEATK
jgi:antitoxin component YwqK of YwqJK toxin-antitoxin module/membrane-associated phospholipid phosphatase